MTVGSGGVRDCVHCVRSQQGLMVGKLRVTGGSVWVRTCAEWDRRNCGEYHYAMIVSVYHCRPGDLQGCCCSTPDISINISPSVVDLTNRTNISNISNLVIQT